MTSIVAQPKSDVVIQPQKAPTALRVAARMEELGTEGAFEILARARELEAKGRDIIHLEIGEPSFATPSHIVDAAIASLEACETRYGPPQGLPALREALSENLTTRGIPRTPDDIVITPGSKPALFYATLALVNPGDEVLVPDPGFPIYPSVVRFAGGVPVTYGFIADGNQQFTIDVAEIASRITKRTRALILNSPHNPTGSTADAATLERLGELAIKHDLVVISDEIYSRLVYDDRNVAPSIAAIPDLADRTVIIDGFSKSWSMTGWRLGYGAFPTALAPRITRLVINAHTCTPAFVQRAGFAALSGPQSHIAQIRTELLQRRNLVVAGLANLAGIPSVAPSGAFYVFADISAFGMSDTEFVTRLLEAHGVATLAGSSFGPRGVGHLRISFGTAFEKLAIALDRISRLCEGLHGGETRHVRH